MFAAGDVANAEHPVLGRRIRVEHWDTAIEQGKTVAHSHARRTTSSYDRLPYFFTDQYDLGMEYVGSVGPDGYDEVVLRGDTSAAGGARSRRSGSRAAGCSPAMHVNDWDAIDHLRGIVGARHTSRRLGDEDVPLDELAAG